MDTLRTVLVRGTMDVVQVIKAQPLTAFGRLAQSGNSESARTILPDKGRDAALSFCKLQAVRDNPGYVRFSQVSSV